MASIITVFSCLLTVEYSPGAYDSWDCLIAGIVILIFLKYLSSFLNDKMTLSLLLLGLSISIMILTMRFIQVIDFKLMQKLSSETLIICNGTFEISIFIFLILRMVPIKMYSKLSGSK
jgi:hypothetical protein